MDDDDDDSGPWFDPRIPIREQLDRSLQQGTLQKNLNRPKQQQQQQQSPLFDTMSPFMIDSYLHNTATNGRDGKKSDNGTTPNSTGTCMCCASQLQ